MRIVALADLHYNDARRARLAALAGAVCQSEADVLVLAGDCSAEGPERLGEVLGLFDGFDGRRLMVPGNHDLWQAEPPFATRRIYEQTLPEIAREHDFECLDQAPAIVDDTAFVGTMGWYDYSMRQHEAPVEDLTVTPINVAPGDDGQPSFSAVEGVGEIAWEDLGPEDYATGGLVWQEGDEKPQVAVWTDATRLDWEEGAETLAAETAERLRAQIEELPEHCERVVGVTHFVPFAELADHHLETPRSAWSRAFFGSPLLGEALMVAEDLALVIYGHRHRQEVREVHGVVTADAAVIGDDGPLLLTLPE